MAKIGPLDRLILDSDEDDDDFFDPEIGLFSRNEVNKPILDFSDSESDSEDDLPVRSMCKGPVESSLNNVLSNEAIQQPETLGVPGTSQSVQNLDTSPAKPFRRVKSLNDALDPSNYLPYTCPIETKEYLVKIKPDGSAKGPTTDVIWTNQYKPSTSSSLERVLCERML